ncbi:uncharacterized protein UV8b_02764 [Ustilaginoidea virens]|uniref:Uncharacterized protein n=1 Tax=Ustilaginoidea virens TaxID=1159556 RepID=A0A8E5HNF9_USTVR|nr:uncharacterized protein UV8b_02764 [Ustilaginoidea virens]QUC18523.1 hypothetical protein UV8b_02764 [Ustilaginoidea virens]
MADGRWQMAQIAQIALGSVIQVGESRWHNGFANGYNTCTLPTYLASLICMTATPFSDWHADAWEGVHARCYR